jgi:hypothetical protein
MQVLHDYKRRKNYNDHRHQQADDGTTLSGTFEARGLGQSHSESSQGSGDQRWRHLWLYHQRRLTQRHSGRAYQKRHPHNITHYKYSYQLPFTIMRNNTQIGATRVT